MTCRCCRRPKTKAQIWIGADSPPATLGASGSHRACCTMRSESPRRTAPPPLRADQGAAGGACGLFSSSKVIIVASSVPSARD